MKKDTIKKQFLDLIKPDIFDHVTISHNWKKMHESGLHADFLVDGGLAAFPAFVVDLITRREKSDKSSDVMTYREEPTFSLKFTGTPSMEVTAVFDEKGFPQGYTEVLDEELNNPDGYSRYFGLLDNHSFFYEDTSLHNGKRVCTYVNLRDCSVQRFTQEHEAYRRIINPAIAKIEEKISASCISHAPSSESQM